MPRSDVVNLLQRYARTSMKVRKGIEKQSGVGQSASKALDRVGIATMATLPVVAGVAEAKRKSRGFDPRNNAAMFGLPPTE